jgi:hypothetical protein
MAVKKNVFASRSERDNYYKLVRIWGSDYQIHHNLPFLNVFDTNNLIDIQDNSNITPIILTPIEINRLKKTSIDFTICDKEDSPILCIEFDGLQQGFNVGATYYPDRLIYSPNPWRREITELKLRVARGSFFPFFVIGSKQFRDISENVKMTIVDGIIGEVLASKESHKTINDFSIEKLSIPAEEFDQMSPQDQHEMIQNWVWYVEIESEFNNNPIVKLRWQMERELNINGFSIENLTYPSIAPGDKQGFNNIILHGNRITYDTTDFGKISGDCWLPNFNMPGFSGWGLSEDIAAIVALNKIKNKRRFPDK